MIRAMPTLEWSFSMVTAHCKAGHTASQVLNEKRVLRMHCNSTPFEVYMSMVHLIRVKL